MAEILKAEILELFSEYRLFIAKSNKNLMANFHNIRL